MQLSQKSLSFANKILKHYPTTASNHKQCQHSCSSHEETAFQPFQHMHDHRKERQIYEKPTQEKLQNIKYFKQLGNNRFKQKKYDQAAYFYQKAIIYSDYTFPSQKSQINQIQLLIQQSNMNLAICLIKQNNWSKVFVNLNEATKGNYDDKDQDTKKLFLNTKKKALYWLTKYYIHQANYQKANQQVQQLQKLDSQISSKQECAQLKKQIMQEFKKHEKKTQNLSKKMFGINV